jgi:hypothetical protein
MDKTTQLVIKAALSNMFKKGWVDICSIKECLKLANITPSDPKTLLQLHALHCVHFTDMEPALAMQIPVMISKVFDGIIIDIDDVFAPHRRPAKSLSKVVDIVEAYKPTEHTKTFMQKIGLSK